VSISKEKWNMEEVVLEELQVFKVRRGAGPQTERELAVPLLLMGLLVFSLLFLGKSLK
jgi:hypothetical protein